jgi:hypothetical protein
MQKRDDLFQLRLQPDLDQAADGFGAAGLVVLTSRPPIDRSDGFVGPTSANLQTLA